MKPKYDLDKIKFATDGPTFEKAVDLYESGKVTKFKDTGFTCTAVVLGSQPYEVFVSNRFYDQGGCTCYLGQNDTLCKHMVSVAIYGVRRGKKLNREERVQVTKPISSGFLGELNSEELKAVKKEITASTGYIKYYSGPSRTWFAYQDSLQEGCNRLSTIISKLPISEQTGGLLVGLLLRLDKKLQSGVDDSDGTVGGFIEETVGTLQDYARRDKNVLKSFKKLIGIESCFGWEEPLVK